MYYLLNIRVEVLRLRAANSINFVTMTFTTYPNIVMLFSGFSVSLIFNLYEHSINYSTKRVLDVNFNRLKCDAPDATCTPNNDC